MARYRVYFVNWNASVAGRDDFDAEDDAQAAVIARLLRHACSDRCAGFELWQGARRVDTLLPKGFDTKQLSSRLQDIVLERELALRDSRWSIADSQRLLEQTQHFLERTARAPDKAGGPAIETETAKQASRRLGRCEAGC